MVGGGAGLGPGQGEPGALEGLGEGGGGDGRRELDGGRRGLRGHGGRVGLEVEEVVEFDLLGPRDDVGAPEVLDEGRREVGMVVAGVVGDAAEDALFGGDVGQERHQAVGVGRGEGGGVVGGLEGGFGVGDHAGDVGAHGKGDNHGAHGRGRFLRAAGAAEIGEKGREGWGGPGVFGGPGGRRGQGGVREEAGEVHEKGFVGLADGLAEGFQVSEVGGGGFPRSGVGWGVHW